MRPNIYVRQQLIDQQDLCRIIIDARTAMISSTVAKAKQGRASVDEMKLAAADADRLALSMATRTMRVRSFDEALQIVKEYVDIKIV